eukprot:UN15907
MNKLSGRINPYNVPSALTEYFIHTMWHNEGNEHIIIPRKIPRHMRNLSFSSYDRDRTRFKKFFDALKS